MSARSSRAHGDVRSPSGIGRLGTDASVPVGSELEVCALDSDDTTRADRLEMIAGGSDVPGPNQCGVQLDPPSPIAKGKIKIGS